MLEFISIFSYASTSFSTQPHNRFNTELFPVRSICSNQFYLFTLFTLFPFWRFVLNEINAKNQQIQPIVKCMYSSDGVFSTMQDILQIFAKSEIVLHFIDLSISEAEWMVLFWFYSSFICAKIAILQNFLSFYREKLSEFFLRFSLQSIYPWIQFTTWNWSFNNVWMFCVFNNVLCVNSWFNYLDLFDHLLKFVSIILCGNLLFNLSMDLCLKNFAMDFMKLTFFEFGSK